MTVKKFINTATDTVHVMIPSPLHGEYHPRTKKTYISSMDSDIDTSNRQIVKSIFSQPNSTQKSMKSSLLFIQNKET